MTGCVYACSIRQIIKRSRLFPTPGSFHRRIDHKIKAWQEFIGADRFAVRLFECGALQGGDVVADFAGYLTGLTGAPVCVSAGSCNSSLTAKHARIMQIFRKTVYPDEPGTLLRRRMGRLSQGKGFVPPPDRFKIDLDAPRCEPAWIEASLSKKFHNGLSRFCGT